ncbi:putative fluoride ion transporter CrcB [Microlunatus endophyticus]|uniref:Fluoride-specific ion channel FluC n=1 Tax=Microlunatus endophyticus TaxID=1716077 RepID=A0A917SG40_9ACTN|nr:fluoride efflux transporter CrcB [Microlunatus endophyticus]GGL79347.1 putative fluoride ion transporter CrcB [Microlunatus endophyticus]
MTPLVFLAVCAAGGVGSASRFVVDGLVRTRFRTVFPAGTAIINISGSFILGLLTGLMLGSVLPQGWELILGTGIMGGYTTFSTASVETMRLVQQREYSQAVVNGFGVILATVLVGLAGLWLGSIL